MLSKMSTKTDEREDVLQVIAHAATFAATNLGSVIQLQGFS
jgi:hypothetical protein